MRIIFFGTPEFAVPSLQALLRSRHEVVAVVAQPERPAGRGLQLQSPPVIEMARAHGLTTLQPEKIRDQSFLNRIGDIAPEIAVVIAYGRILPAALLEIPRRGFINLHASLLPKYRGAAPIQRAIEQGAKETGVTIMRVDPELDHGPILATAPTRIGPQEHSPSLANRLAGLGAEKLLQIIDGLEKGSVVETEQDHRRATYAPKIKKEEGLIDWQIGAESIFNKFRAFDPWPGVFINVKGENIKLTDLSAHPGGGPPGQILSLNTEGMDVGTADGVVRIHEVQRSGKRPVRAIEFARAAELQGGQVLNS